MKQLVLVLAAAMFLSSVAIAQERKYFDVHVTVKNETKEQIKFALTPTSGGSSMTGEVGAGYETEKMFAVSILHFREVTTYFRFTCEGREREQLTLESRPYVTVVIHPDCRTSVYYRSE